MKPLPAGLNQSAWLHGEAAFTTLRTRRGVPLLWEMHLARLAGTCAFLGLPAPEGEPPALDPLPWGLLRLTATTDGLFWSHRPLQPGPRPADGVSVRVTGVQLHPQLAAHKTGNHLPSLLAGREAARAGAFEGWLTDGAGNVVDGARTSPLLELDGRLVVPAGGLPGLTRAAFLRGKAFEERPVRAEELPHVARAWLCGSGVGVVPVREIVADGWRVTLPAVWPDLSDPALIWPG
ncbi:aminotransferase class IV [Deinococcus metallilatus]|uniref:4-amino-4-deoxychorismate lyase n=1 Tax=Deinococcus metallilatus TaxID=1211322 RepID=A0AAJ5JZ13_9DEIO|nr:aminotransferase class IV [Deinococcus metallilatus]MBB5294822.1 4-amino-4-deoxychorismate lyase [Deinococcus metallilatus]QBY09460.1 aminotransferase class IV [Deinococcus metallilatus]RXJ09465.1 aminotransferase class IV [Deinococcus metallilatus]TLK29086.1 aminotransferase class IV [Deinococcus metallilatus]